ERDRDRGVKRNEQWELQQHRKTSADGERVLGQLKLLHLELSHLGIVHLDALFLKCLDLVLDLLHLRRIAGRFFEGFRLLPTEREKQRIEQESEYDDRDAVVADEGVQIVKCVQDRDRERLYYHPDRPVITEVDQ